MAVVTFKVAQSAFRWQGPRTLSSAGRKGFVCGQCQRQKQRRNFHQSAIRREKHDAEINDNEGGKTPASRSTLLSERIRELHLSEKDLDGDTRAKFEALSLENQMGILDEAKMASDMLFSGNSNNTPSPPQSSSGKLPEFKFSTKVLDKKTRAEYEALSPEQQKEFRDEAKSTHEQLLLSREDMARMQRYTQQAIAEYERDAPHIERPKKPRRRASFWDAGEEDSETEGNTDQYQGDDLNELGHAELEQHREIRHYARIAAWEMPLLSKLAKPFKPPDATEMLRFRYTTYLGEEHPAAKKIVLEFVPSDLPDLTEAQRNKLIKLVGPRYNPETNIVKMSSEMFETQAQNKRYLGDLVDTLVREAKDDTDMFEDVPFDFRHHKFKKRIEFPENWVLTAERKQQLEQERKAIKENEQHKMLAGTIVNGGDIHQRAMAALPVKDEGRLFVEQQRRGRKGGPRQMLR